MSEKEGAEECGGVREPSVEGENMAELDIRAGGEPSNDELRSAPLGGQQPAHNIVIGVEVQI